MKKSGSARISPRLSPRSPDKNGPFAADGSDAKSSASAPNTLSTFGRNLFNLKAMSEHCGKEVADRFQAALVDGAKTSEEDSKAIEAGLFNWCSAKNCTSYAHW